MVTARAPPIQMGMLYESKANVLKDVGCIPVSRSMAGKRTDGFSYILPAFLYGECGASPGRRTAGVLTSRDAASTLALYSRGAT